MFSARSVQTISPKDGCWEACVLEDIGLRSGNKIIRAATTLDLFIDSGKLQKGGNSYGRKQAGVVCFEAGDNHDGKCCYISVGQCLK